MLAPADELKRGCLAQPPHASPVRFSSSAVDLLPLGITPLQLLGSRAGEPGAAAQGVEEVRAADTLRVVLVPHLLLVDSCRWTWHSLPPLPGPPCIR
jgi:hypothetical protein